MIECPALKVDATPGYDSSKSPFLQPGHFATQGYVSWGNCLKCPSNQGHNEEKKIIKCGHLGAAVEIESIPV